MNGQLSVLVSSCDKYSVPFVTLFKKYWQDCPYKKILVTETVQPKTELFDEVLLTGMGKRWVDMMAESFEKLDTPYVLLLLDDYLICDYIDNNLIERMLTVADKYDVGALRMIQNPKCSKIFTEEPGFGEYEKGVGYRIALQASIWNVKYLKKITKDYDNIWDFERKGSFKSNEYDQRILCTLKQVFPFEDSVHKGKWEPAAVRLCERNDINIDFNRRGVMSNFLIAKKHFKGAIVDINPTLITKIQNLLSIGAKKTK